MSERPPEEKALFDRVIKLLDASTAQTPATPDDVAQLSDLDAALTLGLILCRDIDAMTQGRKLVRRCGWCIIAAGDTDAAWDAAKQYSAEEIAKHSVQCPHNPLVRAVWAALNAQTALDAIAATERARGHRLTEEREIETVAYATIDTLRRMVGR